MKRLIYILITILTISLSACGPDKRESIDTGYDEVVLCFKDNYTRRVAIYKYEYEGHMYQYHRLIGQTQGGPVHDPDCPCHNKEITNNY